MIYDSLSGALYANDGSFLKTVHCPLGLRVKDLQQLPDGSPDRACHACGKTITCIDRWTEQDLHGALARDPGLCVFATPAAQTVVVLARIGGSTPNHQDLPVIRTARSMDAIIDGFGRGFLPRLHGVGGRERNIRAGQYYKIFQHEGTGEVWCGTDQTLLRPDAGIQEPDPAWRLVSEFWHDPEWPFPMAAYLLPRSLQVGAHVYLEDIIEDHVADGYRSRGLNDSYVPRRVSGAATWDGNSFRPDWRGMQARLGDNVVCTFP